MRPCGSGRAVHPGRPVEGLADCFNWAETSFRRLLELFGEGMYQQLGNQRWTVSTYFSGLGTVEIAMDMLRAAFPPVGRAPLVLEVVSACEKHLGLQKVLMERSPGCVFGNVFDRVGVDNIDSLSVDECRERIADSLVADGQWCLKHNTICRASPALISVAGTSCRPWSKANRGTRGVQHLDMKLFYAWARIMRHDRPTLIIHENVVGFDEGLLVSALGDIYELVRCSRVSPCDVGFGFLRRDRLYHMLALKSSGVSVSPLCNMYSSLIASLAKNVSNWPEWVWRATPEELEEELATCSRRRQATSLTDALGARLVVDGTAKTDALGARLVVDGTAKKWRSLLTAPQAKSLDRYTALWQQKHKQHPEDAPACVFDLGDTPEFKGLPLMRQLPTIRRRRSVWWSPSRERWMLPREKAACMGFPVYDDLARRARVPLDVSTVACADAVGNAMHVANVGVVLLATMYSTRWPHLG